MMLDQAVAFVNKTHGGKAVFWARLDRDEAGRHGVDVFYAPKYEKATKRGTTTWISLTKFGKERAVERFGQKQKTVLNKKTGEFEKVTDKSGDPVMLDCDSKYYQGRAFQDLWFEHLRDVVGLDWVERGKRKLGRDPDRLEVEEYKLKAELETKIATAKQAEERTARAKYEEENALSSREMLREQVRWLQSRAEKAEESAVEAERRAQRAQEVEKAADARLRVLQASVADLEQLQAEEAELRMSVERLRSESVRLSAALSLARNLYQSITETIRSVVPKIADDLIARIDQAWDRDKKRNPLAMPEPQLEQLDINRAAEKPQPRPPKNWTGPSGP